MTKMQEQMRKIQAQMQKLHNTSDPAERQKLMDEHIKLMQHMAGMRGMGGSMMFVTQHR
jgi:hypothetical protein